VPALDTEVLFALDAKDRHHGRALKFLASRGDIIAPDTTILEFGLVMRSMGVGSADRGKAAATLNQALAAYGVRQERTIDARLLARQCELESRFGMTFFDSLIAASALALDGTIVSDDKAFDDVPGLRRISLG